MSVTHLAGPVVSIASEGRAIQRCAVCGEKLADNKGQCAPLDPSGEPPEFLHWEERHYVHCDGNRMSAGADFITPGPLPPDFCLGLIE